MAWCWLAGFRRVLLSLVVWAGLSLGFFVSFVEFVVFSQRSHCRVLLLLVSVSAAFFSAGSSSFVFRIFRDFYLLGLACGFCFCEVCLLRGRFASKFYMGLFCVFCG